MSPSPRARRAGRRVLGVAALAAALLAGLALAPSPAGAVVPTVTVPGPIVMSPGSSLVLSGAAAPRVADPDSSSLVSQIRAVDVADGSSVATLSLDGTAGLTILSGNPNGGTSVKVRGTVAQINAALDGMRIDAEGTPTDLGMLSVTVDDDVTTPDAQLGFTNLRIVDLPPTLVAPTAIALVADEPLDPSGSRELGLADDSTQVRVALSTIADDPADPTRRPIMTVDISAGANVIGDPDGDRELVLIGSPAAVDDALRRTTLTAPIGGVSTLLITATDRPEPNAPQTQRSVTLKASAVAPVLAVPASLTAPTGVDVRLLAPGAPVAVADRDSARIELSILAFPGTGAAGQLTFDLPVVGGLAVVGGQTVDATQVQLEGPPAALDAALRAMTVRAGPGTASPRLIWRIDDVPGPEVGRFTLAFTSVTPA